MRLDLRFQHANPRLAFKAWSDQVHGICNGLQTVAQADTQPFLAHVEVDQAPGLRLGDITAAPQIVVRSNSSYAQELFDDLGLLIQIQGTAQIDHANLQTQLHEGEAKVLDNARAYRLSMPQRFRQGVLLMPRQAWGPRLDDVALQAGHLVPPTASGRLLLEFARSLMQESAQLSEPGLSAAALPLMDLMCAAGLQHDAQGGLRPAESKSLAALRRRVLESVRDKLTRPELNPTLIAQQNGISVRYLHRIFQVQGQTFMGEVNRMRMRLCRRMCEQVLRSQGAGPLRASALAFACGYADDSTFRRVFKAHFGCALAQWQKDPNRTASASISVGSETASANGGTVFF